MDLIKVNVSGYVADVRLNRPDKYNALSTEMFHALIETIEHLMSNQDVRVVVLSGEGKGFCAGLDTSLFKKVAETGGAQGFELGKRYKGYPENIPQFAGIGWQKIPVPVIAAVHGVAYGAGSQIALGADIRIASPEARISLMELQWGLIPDMGAIQSLRNLSRMDVVKKMILSGQVLKGQEAVDAGLFTSLSDTPLESAMELAETIAGRNPDAVRATKYLINNCWNDGDSRHSLTLESELQLQLRGAPNQVEAVKARMENRTPHFG